MMNRETADLENKGERRITEGEAPLAGNYDAIKGKSR